MASLVPNMLLGNQGGVDKSLQATGLPPVGNAGGSNLPGATTINNIAAPAGIYSSGVANPAGGMVPIMQPTTGTTAGTTGTTGSLLSMTGTPSQFSPTQQQNSDKQLTDVFGKG